LSFVFYSHSFFLVTFFFYAYRPPRVLHSFPTRRSSDLHCFRRRGLAGGRDRPRTDALQRSNLPARTATERDTDPIRHRRHLHYQDRKSTRLNSSHSQISYAVFCLKKKKKKKK